MLKRYIPVGAIAGLWGVLGLVTDTTQFIFTYKDNIQISYSLIYSLLVAIGIVTLLYICSELFPWIYKQIRLLKTVPDTSIKEALEYIIDNSCFGKSLLQNQHGRDDAIKAFKDLIFKKRITLYGTNASNPLPTKIDISEIKNDQLIIIYEDGGHSMLDIAYISSKHDGKGEELYKNLSIPLKQLEKEFPHKYPVYRK